MILKDEKNRSTTNGILFVDLDGSLIRTDTLWESLLVLLKTKPLTALFVPFWLFSGKAAFKARISKLVALDPNDLPYIDGVIEFIEHKKESGQTIVLATAANNNIAKMIAAHLGFFDDVLASTNSRNLKGLNKLEVILEYADGKPFDYIGDSQADIPIWQKSETAYAVAPSHKTSLTFSNDEKWNVIEDRIEINLMTLLKAIRIHQWAKNTLLFAPLFLAHRVGDASSFLTVLLGFIAFSMTASATYLWNDLLDLADDRKHPKKKHRPLASGLMTIPTGIFLSVLLIFASVVISIAALPTIFLTLLLGYIALTVSYSFYFKTKLMADVLLLAGLYTYRILIGGAAVDVEVSSWLLMFSIFFFLSLAFVKRYIELANMKTRQSGKLDGRGYFPSDLEMVRSLGTSSGYVSILVFTLYLNSSSVLELYATPRLLWLIGPCLVYWLSRIWFLSARGHMNEDPVLFSIHDRISQAVGVVIIGLLFMASI